MMITEGNVKIAKDDGVFYNPQMEINRDLLSIAIGVLGVKTFCDGHSATGIKAIRASAENTVESVDAVELSANACDTIRKNVALNGMTNINIVNEDVRFVLMRKNYEFVEIDPFGTPAPYFYALADSFSWRKSGYFSMTATDTAVLCGAEAKACRRMYGAVPFHKECVHEAGLRILIGRIQSIFAKDNIAVTPLLSLSHRHYLKVFMEAKKSAQQCDRNLDMIKYFAYCEKCKGRRYIKPGDSAHCETCNAKMLVAGPMWAGLLHNTEFLDKMMAECERRRYKNAEEELRILHTLRDENFEGFCYDLHTLYRGAHIPKTLDVIERLRSKGFKAAQTTYKNWIIRTDAPDIKEIQI